MSRQTAVLAVGLNPTMQKTLLLDRLWVGEVNRTNAAYIHASGKGANTARVLTELGAQVFHLTHAGGRQADLFTAMLEADGIKLFCVDSQSELRTCCTLISREEGSFTEIVEEALPVHSGTEEQIRDTYLELLTQTGIVTISGTRAPGYSDELIPWMVAQAANLGKQVVLDIKGEDLMRSLPHGPYVIKPNMKEFAETLFPDKVFHEHGKAAYPLDLLAERMKQICRTYGVHPVITQSCRPVIYAAEDTIYTADIDEVVPVNPIGSGDAFTAGLAWGLSLGYDLHESVRQGIRCGKLNALTLKPGSISRSS